MTFASADRVQLAFSREQIPGTINPAAVSHKLRMTGESLAFDLTKTPDSEITADAQPTSSTTTNASAAGDINLHVQYAEYDPLIAGVLRSAWVPHGLNGVSAPFDADFTANTIVADVAQTANNAFTRLLPGQWFRLKTPAGSHLLRVSSTVAPTATTITLDPNTPMQAGDAAACTISASRLANGTDLSSFTVEKQITDVDHYFTFRGMHPSKLSMQFATESDTKGTISFMGFNQLSGDASLMPGVLQESNPYEIHNGIVGVGQLWEGGAPAEVTVRNLSFDVDSGLRMQTALGSLGAVGMGIGTLAVTGSITLYFENGALYDKYLKDTYTSLVFSSLDVEGNGYIITIPRLMLGQGRVVAGGKNSDLMAEFQIEAQADRRNPVAALRKTVIIDRVGVAVAPI